MSKYCLLVLGISVLCSVSWTEDRSPQMHSQLYELRPWGSSVGWATRQDNFYNQYIGAHDNSLLQTYYREGLRYDTPYFTAEYFQLRDAQDSRKEFAKRVFRQRLDQTIRSYLTRPDGGSGGKKFIHSVDRIRAVPVSGSSPVQVRVGYDLLTDISRFEVQKSRVMAQLYHGKMLDTLLSGQSIDQGMGMGLRVQLNETHTAAFANYGFSNQSIETGIYHPFPRDWSAQLSYRRMLKSSDNTYELLFRRSF